jgi:hypothetical protein
MAVHKDLLAGTEPHIITPIEETQGFVYQMDIRRPESAPLLLTGVYLPTGPTAPYIRPGLYKHIERQHQAHPHHVHILAGDMNATLYPTDRDPGRKGSLDPQYRQFIHNLGLLPLDHPSDHTQPGRERTFYTKGDPSQGAVSRIDDILTNTEVASQPGHQIQTMDTTDLNTDHQGLIAHLPYTALGQLPLPKPKSPRTTPQPQPSSHL